MKPPKETKPNAMRNRRKEKLNL